ncbi:porin family protein [Winogradskyella pulchriflava]|uniref:Porin family protein n=1 Tax=Winogradskyella pulchriflava TaxID=1110688 RepID=A0ABV6QAY5_9FLAO
MKKIILSVIVAFCSIFTVNAQDENVITNTEVSYGVKAGYNSFVARASADGNSVSVDESGFYFGIFADFAVSDKFNIQPELQYVVITGDGDNGNVLVVPILGKYAVSEKFNLLAGPQLDYVLDDDAEGLKRLGVGLALGLAFDINENFIIDLRYSLGISNRLDIDDDDFGDQDVKVKFNYVQVGLGYRF